jgi:hypothetical protein
MSNLPKITNFYRKPQRNDLEEEERSVTGKAAGKEI